MNTNEMNDGNIFFLNFTFNRKLRILQQGEQVTQLRKKEAEVLALLCDSHPNPVSQDDFLMKVWGGGYVTSQSIAQVIRSLRRSLGDDKKSTISTIPKLGYKLTITPIYEDVLPTKKIQYGDVLKISHERDDFSYTEQKTPINGISSSSSISIIPYVSAKKKIFSSRKIVFSSVILILASLVGVTININSNIVDNSDNAEKNTEKETPVLVLRQKNNSTNTDDVLTYCGHPNEVFVGLLNNNVANDCFVN